MLVATPAELAERRAALGRSATLARLGDRLRALLGPILERPTYVPEQKALLSRDGGVCPRDGSRLRFDPLEPQRHQCPRCGETYQGVRHHRAWIVRYQIWLSERAVHLALLGELDREAALRSRATEILDAYAARYRDYPNRDNVLGPTRLFFSTYLESIWLCQVVVAASLLDGFAPAAARERWRAMVAESAALIASFDEEWSNRQAWNNAALIAAGRWLDAPELVARGLDGAHGVRAQLRHGVSADGLWFEGENYHFFALRGLLFAAEMLRTGGVDLYRDPEVGGPLASLYTGPLATVLPDLTLPARGDAPYGVSLLQPRFAELWEIGRARTSSAVLQHLLTHLYAAAAPDGEDHGLAELAEQEQNRPAQRLSRERLGWKALVWMLEADPSGNPAEWQPGSILLADHGLAVMRGKERYVSVECGGHPGGHGHPDLLHVTLYWSLPWLMDPGTGSYVSPSLHWYRSTLAHNAPGVAGAGQASREGWCSAFAEVDGWGWVRVEAQGLLGPHSWAVRTLLVAPDYVLDALEIEAPPAVTVDLAIHPLGAVVLPASVERQRGTIAPATLRGEEHGYDAVKQSARVVGPVASVSARREGAELWIALAPRPGEDLLLASAFGPPDLNLAEGRLLEFIVRRAHGSGRWVQVYSREPVEVTDGRREIRVARPRGVDVVRLTDREARVTPAAGDPVRLEGRREAPAPAAARPAARRVMTCPLLREVPALESWEAAVPAFATHRLGAERYRRSEEAYRALEFAARVAVFAAGRHLCFAIDVTEPELVVRRPDAPDPALDNESPDIHSDGVQCYVDVGGWQGFLLLPDLESSRVYIRAVNGAAGAPSRMAATWGRTETGYRMLIRFDVGRTVRRGDQFPVNLVVNRLPPGRERRAGQLVLSGEAGWVYLRGDREPPESAVVAEIV